MKGYLKKSILVLAGCLAYLGLSSQVLAEVVLEDISFATLPGGRFEVRMDFSDTPPAPDGYTIDNPARIVLDLPSVASALDQKKYALSFENARSAVVLGTSDRTRVILNMLKMAPYETHIDGNSIVLLVGANDGVARSAPRKASIVGAVASEDRTSAPTYSIQGVDFRRGEEGEGLVVIDLSNPATSIDISQSGGDVKLRFFRTMLPESLDRRLDVVDFATPVKEVDASFDGSTSTVLIKAVGEYDYMAYQTDDQYIVSLKPLSEEELENQRSKFAYVGEKLSLNFQDIEVRSVLQLIADFTDLNLVASDTVSGSITLRLENVPWDQALDIVLKAKGLDKRQEGNVLMVAPAAEIAERERLQVEANKQLQELAPLRTEFIRVKYADAKALYELFDVRGGSSGGSSGSRTATDSILSERGSAIVDNRTNTIILTDTEDKILEFKRLIDQIDIPVKQVLIEARIVIANRDFRKEIGARMGLQGLRNPGNSQFGFSGSLEGFDGGVNPIDAFDGTPGIGSILVNDAGLGVDLGVEDPNGSFALELLTNNTFIDLELSALENEGKGEIVSQPKVLTGDKQQASIKTGTEIPYQNATSSGATSTQFKEAVLLLEVTPQITPDGRIVMDINVAQDSVGDLLPTGEPVIDITQVETKAIVGDGQTLVLGGLFQMQTVDNVEKVPFLGDVPYLGRLFRHDIEDIQKREILIFITPKILNEALLD
ncbi:type IV pilus secretin PilQ [Porticoccus hydrocarbonoclasticus]|jgi:type IV pilus assembly protein PilQ|uniref:type IV pilus secretin PilQ n=1 Tax=Porticoccus hydrocarbonoclasticus TaxID=1073414 RepID=UPI00056916F0|nr:type IV pilus secretin PilQ family protein [Porticoccus hydrocarbonoclasticus]|tara:strand:- start:5268 stop:7415 length:2148 start_codon:yes stop_codon:yes gene_type:complete